MAKNTKKANDSKSEVFCWPVQFGSMSPGKTGAKLSFSLPEGKKPGCINVGLARQLFGGSRLQVAISIDSNANPDAAHTDELFGDSADRSLEATADAKSFRYGNGRIGSALTFNTEEVDEADVLAFHDQVGYLRVERIGGIPAKPKKGKTSDDVEGQTTFGDEEE